MESEIIISEEGRERLRELEAIIKENIKGFLRVGMALKEIKDQQLYKAKYSRWKDYCRIEWSLGRAYAERMIASSEVVQNVTNCQLDEKCANWRTFESEEEEHLSGAHPINECQVRPLVRKGFEPDTQRMLWQRAVSRAMEENYGRVTGAIVSDVVNDYVALRYNLGEDGPVDYNDPFRRSETFNRGFRGFLKQVEEAIETNFRATSKAAVLAALDEVRARVEPAGDAQLPNG